MRKFSCVLCALLVLATVASEAKAFGLGLGFGLFGGFRRQNVVVNNFQTGLGGQAAFIQRPAFVQQAVFADPCVVGQSAFIQRSAFVPSSTVVIGGGVQRIGGLRGGVGGGQQRVIIRR